MKSGTYKIGARKIGTSTLCSARSFRGLSLHFRSVPCRPALSCSVALSFLLLKNVQQRSETLYHVDVSFVALKTRVWDALVACTVRSRRVFLPRVTGNKTENRLK